MKSLNYLESKIKLDKCKDVNISGMRVLKQIINYFNTEQELALWIIVTSGYEPIKEPRRKNLQEWEKVI